MQDLTFTQLELAAPILKAVERQGYTTPTPIQAQAIPALIAGSDMLGTAQTGTGKTAAFVLPLLHRLVTSGELNTSLRGAAPAPHGNRRPSGGKRGDSRRPQRAPVQPAQPRALILAPTRELAIQIGDSIHKYSAGSQVRHTVIFGGAPKPNQSSKLMGNPDILAATPGRLMDFISEGRIDLSRVEVMILDEADRMLDMGFIPEVRRIAAMAPDRNQTMLFSATMPSAIEQLARELLDNPERIAIAPKEITVDRIQQTVLHLNRDDKTTLLPKLIQDHSMFKVIVFTRTKHRAARLAKQLSKLNIPSDAIHGDRTQGQRQRALESFKRGKIQALVATDVAARGIDIDDVTHVINFEIPNEAESYVHRIGRTARAGTEGTAIAMCARDEIKDFRAIEKLLGSPIEVDRNHEFHEEPPAFRGPRSGGGAPRGGRPHNGGGNRRRSSAPRDGGFNRFGESTGRRPDSRRPSPQGDSRGPNGNRRSPGQGPHRAARQA